MQRRQRQSNDLPARLRDQFQQLREQLRGRVLCGFPQLQFRLRFVQRRQRQLGQLPHVRLELHQVRVRLSGGLVYLGAQLQLRVWLLQWRQRQREHLPSA